MFEAEIALLKAHLKVEHWTVEWQFREVAAYNFNKRKFTATLGDYERLGPTKALIRVAYRRSKVSTLETLAHELRHLWQDDREVNEVVWLPLKRKSVPLHKWQGSEFLPAQEYLHTTSSRWYLPEEIDARAYASWTLEHLFPNLERPHEVVSKEKELTKLFLDL